MDIFDAIENGPEKGECGAPALWSDLSGGLDRKFVYRKALTQWGIEGMFNIFWTYRENDILVSWGFGKAKITI